MPRGQSPEKKLDARYSLLNKQLDRMQKDYSFFTKVRRKVNEFLGTSSGQLVTTQQRTLIKKKVEKIEENWRKAGKMKDRVREDQTP